MVWVGWNNAVIKWVNNRKDDVFGFKKRQYILKTPYVQMLNEEVIDIKKNNIKR